MVDFSDLWSNLDLAGEHYHPHKLFYLEHLKKQAEKCIGEHFISVRKIFDPTTEQVPAKARVYDVTDALGNFLKEGRPVASVEDVGSTKKIAQPGDVIVSRLRSYLREIAVVPELDHTLLISTEFIVLRRRGHGKAHFLLPYLLSEPVQIILQWSQDGSNHPRFAEDVLLDLPLPTQILKHEADLTKIVEEAILSFGKSKSLYAEAEALLLSELGLDDLDLSHQPTYTRNFRQVWSAGRLDAEHFQPKYYRLEEVIQSGRFSTCVLGELIEPIRNGFDYRNFAEEGTPYIRVGDIRVGRIDIEGTLRVPITIKDVDKDIALQPGDILFTRKGTFGNAAVVRQGQEHVIISSEIMLLRLKDRRVRPDYLALFLNSQAGYLQVERRVHGVAFYSISQTDLASILVPIACEDIQEQLSSLVMCSIKTEQKAKRLLEEAKRRVEAMIL